MKEQINFETTSPRISTVKGESCYEKLISTKSISKQSELYFTTVPEKLEMDGDIIG
jgi:hypothetical protein